MSFFFLEIIIIIHIIRYIFIHGYDNTRARLHATGTRAQEMVEAAAAVLEVKKKKKKRKKTNNVRICVVYPC